MEIIIHRGTHQIGGCITEISTDEARIVIDMGSSLPGSAEEIKPGDKDDSFSLDGVINPLHTGNGESCAAGARPCDAVFVTHYHGDHIGLVDRLLPDIPLYLGPAAREIYAMYCARVGAEEKLRRLGKARLFISGRPVRIKDMTITPILTDHSALDAYMLLIEGDGKTVLHTGDFTLHGHAGKSWLRRLKDLLSEKNEPIKNLPPREKVKVSVYFSRP